MPDTRPLMTDGVAIAGVIALTITAAIMASGMGPDATLHLFRMGGALAGILAIGTMLTMSVIGVLALVGLALRGLIACCDIAIALLERGRGAA